jgi:hypothetical protein|tara:strand:- start:125 stop:346 length:222 start_codon:yes stop_codon:yes gene_type:complete
MSSNIYDWQYKKEWQYKGITDPEYIKDRDKLFKENGNGWWWGWHLVPPSKRPIDLWQGKTFEPKPRNKNKCRK